MSASRLAIMAGLLTLALVPGTGSAARKERAIEAARPLEKLGVAQIGADYFIEQLRSAEPANRSVSLGSTVHIDQRLLESSVQFHAGDKQ